MGKTTKWLDKLHLIANMHRNFVHHLFVPWDVASIPWSSASYPILMSTLTSSKSSPAISSSSEEYTSSLVLWQYRSVWSLWVLNVTYSSQCSQNFLSDAMLNQFFLFIIFFRSHLKFQDQPKEIKATCRPAKIFRGISVTSWGHKATANPLL